MLRVGGGAGRRHHRVTWQQITAVSRPGGGLPGSWIVLGTDQTPTALSGREWQGAQSGQGAVELDFPGPALGEMQGEAPRLAGDASG